MKIVTRLNISFSLMLLGALVLGVLGARSIVHLSGISADIFRHPFALTTAGIEKDMAIARERFLGNPADMAPVDRAFTERRVARE